MLTVLPLCDRASGAGSEVGRNAECRAADDRGVRLDRALSRLYDDSGKASMSAEVAKLTMVDTRRTPLIAEEIEPHACSVGMRLRLLSQLPFFAGLSPEQVSEINELFHERGYAADEIIYSSGEPGAHLYVVAAGKVKLIRHTLGGQDVVIDMLTQGEFFGSLGRATGETMETSQAQTMCCVLVIAASDF